MIHLVTYANAQMSISLDKCKRSAMKNGFDGVVEQTLGADFVFFNAETLNMVRGAGYWLWKPYLIARAMLYAKEGDIVVYADAGVEFINSTHYIIDRMDEDVFFFTNGFPHVEWCKGDVITSILGWSDLAGQSQHFSNFKQVQASVIFFKVNENTRKFVKEWLLYSQMPGFIDDSPSKAPNYPTFAEHRHDQAILTCLQIKYGYKLHWWPTQYSEHIRVPGDDYPVIFNHHRKRNHEW